MTGNDIRKRFLTYFADKGHTVVESSGLVPHDDPTLLFVNAGMVQFKRVFMGEDQRDYTRAVTCQRCVRAGGKHNDLENVGYTARHHTFFEMLGNFSFGDYFKKDAIHYAWDFLTKEVGLPPEKLWVSVFDDDDEAFGLWEKVKDLPPGRIVRMGEKDNFWAMGDTGPCGPCSEIHIDQGVEAGCGKPDCKLGCDCDRFLEIWNLVFMQFNRSEDGTLTPLPKPSIDTGMGLERIAAVTQGKFTNYDSDLFAGIIAAIAQAAGVRYGEDAAVNTALRVIADHSRATTFLVADGVLPSNEGRGYVLRRIMRRAIRFGRSLGLKKPFLNGVIEAVIAEMGEAYPHLHGARELLAKVVHHEEVRFLETLDNGLAMLHQEMGRLQEARECSFQKLVEHSEKTGQPNSVKEEVQRLKKTGALGIQKLVEYLQEIKQPDLVELAEEVQRRRVVSGEFIFKLYDTFGFPVDIVKDIAIERGMLADEAGFNAAMEVQRNQSKKSWKATSLAEMGAGVRPDRGRVAQPFCRLRDPALPGRNQRPGERGRREYCPGGDRGADLPGLPGNPVLR